MTFRAVSNLSKLNKSSVKIIGVPLTFLFIDILARSLMITFFFNLGTYVQRMVEIDPQIAYKYTYPTLDPESQTFPVAKLGNLIAIMALTGFVLNHVFLRIIGCPSEFISIDAYHFLMATTMAALSIMTLVQSLKLWVSRPRPDFLSRCYPDGFDFRSWKRVPDCTRPLEDARINDGIQSFPSGHSAGVWSASVFCFLYLREQYIAHSHHTPSRVPRCVPFLFAFSLAIFASYVSCSRLWDFQHHPEDVIAGGLIGCILTYLSFFLYYPISSIKSSKKRRNAGYYSNNLEESDEPILDGCSTE